MTSRSFTLAVTALAAGMAVAACSRSDLATAPLTGTANAAAAAQFNRMGDSVIAAGGSPSDAAPFYGAAGVLDQAPDFQSVSIDIDGTATPMNAVAVAVEIFGGPMIACPVPAMETGAAAPYVCPWGVPRVTRTLFAWTPARPTRIVTLVASTDSGSIGTPVPVAMPGSATPSGMGTSQGALVDSDTSIASAVARPIPAHLEFNDARRTWWGISGTQSNTVTLTGAPCRRPPADSASAPHPDAIPVSRCQLADFTFSFSGTVARPPVAIFGDANMTGTHTLNMGLTPVKGVYLNLLSAALVTPP
jgi:hypothetical protein